MAPVATLIAAAVLQEKKLPKTPIGMSSPENDTFSGDGMWGEVQIGTTTDILKSTAFLKAYDMMLYDMMPIQFSPPTPD